MYLFWSYSSRKLLLTPVDICASGGITLYRLLNLFLEDVFIQLKRQSEVWKIIHLQHVLRVLLYITRTEIHMLSLRHDIRDHIMLSSIRLHRLSTNQIAHNEKMTNKIKRHLYLKIMKVSFLKCYDLNNGLIKLKHFEL